MIDDPNDRGAQPLSGRERSPPQADRREPGEYRHPGLPHPRSRLPAELARANLGSEWDGTGATLSYAAYAPVARTVRGLLQRPDGNNVSVERESLLLAETQMKFNLGVQLLKDEFKTISQAINSGGASS